MAAWADIAYPPEPAYPGEVGDTGMDGDGGDGSQAQGDDGYGDEDAPITLDDEPIEGEIES
jgi:hypothetical protein